MSLNKVLLMGNLGSDPELRYTQSQSAICSFRLATNERRKGADGQWTDHTEWHKIVTFGKTAENCNQYLKKGRPVFIEGKIQTRKYQDKEGKDQYWTEIIGSSVQFLNSGSREDRMGMEKTVTSNASTGDAPFTMPDTQAVSFDDDDIPF